MNTCIYHSTNPAVVQCNSCGRGLCPACDHRIRGFPFCQDCIVAGVEALRRQQQTQAAHGAQPSRRKNSPFLALLLSLLVPGLGAAYNGQTSKAIVHFTIFASFFQMAIVTDALSFFVLGVIFTLLFAAVDAYRTAQLLRAGLAPEAESDAITKRLYGNPFAWGAVLVVLGVVFMLHTLLGVQLPVRRFLPVALVLLGIYMLIDHGLSWRKRQAATQARQTFDSGALPPPALFASRGNTGALDELTVFRTGDLTVVPPANTSARHNDIRGY